MASNELIIAIQPNEAIYLKINNKVPGLGTQLDSSELNLLYREKYVHLSLLWLSQSRPHCAWFVHIHSALQRRIVLIMKQFAQLMIWQSWSWHGDQVVLILFGRCVCDRCMACNFAPYALTRRDLVMILIWCCFYRYDDQVMPDSYERLILDVIKGDNHLFIRSDELEATWDLLTPLLKEVEENQVVPELYTFGGRGPIGAYYLGAKHGVRWADE